MNHLFGLDHQRLAFIGDTVTVRWKIMAKKEISKPDRGVVTEEVRLLNQRGEPVAEGLRAVMM